MVLVPKTRALSRRMRINVNENDVFSSAPPSEALSKIPARSAGQRQQSLPAKKLVGGADSAAGRWAWLLCNIFRKKKAVGILSESLRAESLEKTPSGL
jgi:hypothetical protein